ncbi:hypothetical protein [Stenotrophomonas sp. TD3]|uniref:hypothetical protein n=1 Tax=Stenotrophomonas sp. TD3 TaxID=1641707 RepID=UPI000A6325F6|nr:hypothetical protein [Stenotrophomonas sp. TD3]
MENRRGAFQANLWPGRNDAGWGSRHGLLMLAALFLSACSEPVVERPMNALVGPYLARPGVDPVGDNAVVVHLSLRDGRVIEGPGRGAGTPWTHIRLLVRVGSTLPAAAGIGGNADIRREGGGFVRIIAAGRPSGGGILSFEGPCGHRVLARQMSGDSIRRGNYLAEMQMDGVFLQYLYGAENRADHRRYATWVYDWFTARQGHCANGDAWPVVERDSKRHRLVE